ncbi:class I SAM-dependent methyltransferase [Dyadobacter chenwenxiniae]|uniref:Class I SAM-dependent methyltransferase n=1 Tax=Dyadobacter chenwenxiniae TaxID=2906456 RepID=A0A9X1PJC6_9BACT|nr:class I SAM-dependent methyltransferase [Dyadobacter chenwenxiniae]MCF0061816.1 class I SAM-dependent methyltransferase [Dyadobacter chenwenxiniae]UON81631.1 class I SAM-dependent methyltransferase [Dyadobacter chenwenxiniae]
MDKSNGYEHHAATFIRCRSKGLDGVGVASVQHWARSLPPNATVLDVGCGTGDPISKALIDEGLNIHGIDASTSMVQIFKQNFPGIPVACEAAEDSSFFNRQFDAIMAWGLMFLLPEKTQEVVIQKMANALRTGGKLLFTAPSQKMKWEDAITAKESRSLGAEKYKALLAASGLSLIEEFEDEGENHYYHAEKL